MFILTLTFSTSHIYSLHSSIVTKFIRKSTSTSLSDKKIVMHYLYSLSLRLIKIAECSIYQSSCSQLQVEIMQWNEMKIRKLSISNKVQIEWLFINNSSNWEASASIRKSSKRSRWKWRTICEIRSRMIEWKRVCMIMHLSNAYVFQKLIV